MRRFASALIAVSVAASFCGCAHYEYRIVQPANFAQPIQKTAVTAPSEPLQYRFALNDDRISMRVVNPTDDVVSLVPYKSYVVDPTGETHPIRGRAIAPHSYVSMILPPQPIVYRGAGYWGWGAGFGYYDPFLFHTRVGPPYMYPYGFYDPFFYEPDYYYRVLTPYDWEWKTGEVRLRLEYDRTGTNFVHTFVFDKRKL